METCRFGLPPYVQRRYHPPNPLSIIRHSPRSPTSVPPRKKAKTLSEQEQQTPSFETTIHRLGEIVEQLEGGELPLEESLKLFEEGVGLARASQKILDAAERRVEKLLGVDESGEPILEEMGEEF